LLSPKQAGKQDPRPKEREQGSDGVELGREDLEHNQGKRELSDGGAHVGAFKGSLCGANLDELGAGQHDRVCAVPAQLVVVGSVASLLVMNSGACTWGWRWIVLLRT
jgi:hypothetical protein